MKEKIRIKSTSRSSAVGQSIILRSTSTTRLIFIPEIVSNPKNPEASVRGTFIFQRKRGSGEWRDYKTLDLNKLKDGEWIKLELRSAELYELVSKLDQYYEVFEKFGIKPGETEFLVTPRNAKSVIESFLENPENFEKLQELEVGDLEKLNIISSINSLKGILEVWDKNSSNDDEEFWQEFFKDNSWVIAQVFSYPVILLKDKAYLGGKTVANKGGAIVDFIYKSGFTDNVLLVEIKAPTTQILGKEYRAEAFSWNAEISGSTSQLLRYKHQIQKSYLDIADEENLYAFDPPCMLIVGNARDELTTKAKIRSFSLLRNDSRNIQIVTYDELFEKVKTLVELLES